LTIPEIILIIAKPEKLLMVAIYRQGFCTLLVHIFLSFFLEESVGLGSMRFGLVAQKFLNIE
jgi:hypothetical protein